MLDLELLYNIILLICTKTLEKMHISFFRADNKFSLFMPLPSARQHKSNSEEKKNLNKFGISLYLSEVLTGHIAVSPPN
jgi:hypothetical protein